VISGGGLSFWAGEAGGVICEVFGDDNGEIGGRKEEDLISEEAGDPCKGHRTTVTG
jgi:hypothetical protein